MLQKTKCKELNINDSNNTIITIEGFLFGEGRGDRRGERRERTDEERGIIVTNVRTVALQLILTCLIILCFGFMLEIEL